jgi:hypothetical protein
MAEHWMIEGEHRFDRAPDRQGGRLRSANIAVLRRRALDVARLDQSKGSLTVKLKRAGWNDEFMLKLLSQMR